MGGGVQNMYQNPDNLRFEPIFYRQFTPPRTTYLFVIFSLKAQAIANQAEKRQRQFDKSMEEWKQKCADLQHELDVASSDARSNAGEVYKLKAQMEEYNETIEALRRENKNLSGEEILVLFFQFPPSL